MTGEQINGVARLVDQEPLVRRLHSEKYGLQKRLIESASGLVRAVTRKPAEEAVFLEITPLADAIDVRDTRAA